MMGCQMWLIITAPPSTSASRNVAVAGAAHQVRAGSTDLNEVASTDRLTRSVSSMWD